MNRIDRLSAILIQLQSQRIVKAQSIAERFDISLRTVYRDIKSLEQAGIPLIGEAGVGYSLADGYRLPPIMFTREEATAFITAEKLVKRLTDSATSVDFSSAIFKIKAVLKNAEKEYLNKLDAHIEVVKSSRQLQSKSDLNLLPCIMKSITDKKALCIDYFTHYRQQASVRCIEPIGIIYLENYWHLIAYCKMRNALRDFRMDRILSLYITTDDFENEHPTLQQYLLNTQRDVELHEIVLHVDKKIYPHLDEQKYYSGFVSETHKDNYIEMQFFSCSIEGFARWFMMFGAEARIIKSDLLKEQVSKLLKAISENLYKK